jgi:hypothetical protein
MEQPFSCIWTIDGVLRYESKQSRSVGDLEVLPAPMLFISVGKNSALIEVDDAIARTTTAEMLVASSRLDHSGALRHVDVNWK